MAGFAVVSVGFAVVFWVRSALSEEVLPEALKKLPEPAID